ncbi:MAG: hypothetical protein K0R39_3786 [Symbiobacteriaceae bacterium]|nr:hypothetical protein [Symbiobacteriaceae bacterium]
MNCDGVSSLLSAYLDGELSPGELLRVEEHLRRCHACADEVDSLRQTVALVASLEEVEVPASFQMQLHQRLVALGPPVAAVRRAPAVPAWQRNVRRWGLPAAAAAAALAIGLTTFDAGRLTSGLMAAESEYNLPVPKQTTTQVDNPNNNVTAQQGSNQQTTGPDSTKPDDPKPQPVVVQSDPPVIPPGDTNPGDGPKGVSTDDPGQPVNVAAQMEYVYNVAVKGTIDPETMTLVRTENANAFINDNTLTIQVPVADREAVLAKVLKTYWPGSTMDDNSHNIGADIETARKQYDAAKVQVEADEKNPPEAAVATQHLQQRDEAKANYELMLSKTTFATIIVTFTP